MLEELGFVDTQKRASAASGGDDLSKALRAYQRSQGLPETGTFDLDTLYSFTDQPGLNGDRAEFARLPPGEPETSVAFDLGSGQATTAPRLVGVPSSAPVTGQAGTGATLAEVQLGPEELLELSNATPSVAPYELKAGRRDE